jgi:hypothetical protein
MGYSNYKNLKQALNRLGLEQRDVNLFPNLKTVKPSNWLKQSLLFADRTPLTNEKSKSERVIAPILLEVAIAFESQITLYSGEDLTVDTNQDLSGECDFFFSKHPRKSVMQAPIITFVEAKAGCRPGEDFEYGQAQCIAQMYASQLFNEQEGKPIPIIYGCAVTAGDWKFLKLENNQVFIDTRVYYLVELPKILGVFHHIIKSFLD